MYRKMLFDTLPGAVYFKSAVEKQLRLWEKMRAIFSVPIAPSGSEVMIKPIKCFYSQG